MGVFIFNSVVNFMIHSVSFFMRISIFLLFFSVASFAQQVNFPPRCDDRLLNSMDSALCEELLPLAKKASYNFERSILSVKSLKDWDDLQIVKLKLISSYYSCSIAGSADNVISCFRPVLQKTIESIPEVNDFSPGNTVLQVRTVGRMIEKLAYDKFKNCVYERVKKIDDGVSTAGDIAQGVGHWCRPAAAKLADVTFSAVRPSLFSSSATFAQLQKLTDNLLLPSNLVVFVLEYRAKKKAQ